MHFTFMSELTKEKKNEQIQHKSMFRYSFEKPIRLEDIESSFNRTRLVHLIQMYMEKIKFK